MPHFTLQQRCRSHLIRTSVIIIGRSRRCFSCFLTYLFETLPFDLGDQLTCIITSDTLLAYRRVLLRAMCAVTACIRRVTRWSIKFKRERERELPFAKTRKLRIQLHLDPSQLQVSSRAGLGLHRPRGKAPAIAVQVLICCSSAS